MRGGMCVVVRDLVVFSVLTDMMRGRPAVYATFASYDEVAHHSGLERADTLEALRKLDQQFGRIARARRYAPRPYEIVVLSDHGQTQGATFKQRHGYGLDELVERSVSGARVAAWQGGDEQQAMVGHAAGEATGRKWRSRPRTTSRIATWSSRSGNLGLIYLMDADHRLTLEEIDERHPDLIGALREPPAHRLVAGALRPRGARSRSAPTAPTTSTRAASRASIRWPRFSPTAPQHLLRTDGFAHVADIMVGSFYDARLDEGCAFEELISFHGGLGGPQTRPFILHPPHLEVPDAPIVGAAAVHDLLVGWRRSLARGEAPLAVLDAEAVALDGRPGRVLSSRSRRRARSRPPPPARRRRACGRSTAPGS